MGNKTPAHFQIEHHSRFGRAEVLLKGKSISYVRAAFDDAVKSHREQIALGDSLRLTQGGRLITSVPPRSPRPADPAEVTAENERWAELRKGAPKGRKRVFK